MKSKKRKHEIPESVDTRRQEIPPADHPEPKEAALEIARAVRPLHRMARENDLHMIAYLLEMVALQAQDELTEADDD